MEYQSFVGGSYQTQSTPASPELTINWIYERLESQGAVSRFALYPTPGVEAITMTLPAISQPATPVVTNQGAAGATTYGYKVVALLGDDSTHSQASAEGTTATGNATLTGVNFNRLNWTASTNAVSYIVYRTTGGATPPVKLATVTALTYDDTGTAGTAETPASTNTTGVVFTPTGPGRGAFSLAGRYFFVQGTIFYELSQTGLLTPRGLVAIGTNPATISSNGDGGGQLFITSGDNGYVYDLTTNLISAIANLAGKATMGDSLDGYFLALDATASKLYISDLLDGTTWDPNQFAQRSIAPDPWRSMRVNGRYIWLLGTETSEPWYDTGDSPFPFAPYPSLLIPYGIVGAFTVAVSEGIIVWFGASKTGQREVLRASGFTPEVVSDFPTQYIFNGYSTVSDAQADMVNYLGHPLYLLTFPTEDITWVWDSQSNKWSNWGTWISEDNEFIAWRPRWHALAFGNHMMLDAAAGNVYRMAADLTMDVEERPIRRVRRAPVLQQELERVYFSRLVLDVEMGLGTSTGQGSDPQMMMRYSNDGGQTWGTEIMCSVGKIGQYSRRCYWNRLGMSRRRVFEVSGSDPVPYRIMSAYIELGQPVKGVRSARGAA